MDFVQDAAVDTWSTSSESEENQLYDNIRTYPPKF